MQLTMTAYSMHEVRFLPVIVPWEVTQQVWRCSSRHIVSHVSEVWVNRFEVRDELESPLVVTHFLCTIEARRFSQVSRIQSHHGPRSDTSANRITAPLPNRDEAPTS